MTTAGFRPRRARRGGKANPSFGLDGSNWNLPFYVQTPLGAILDDFETPAGVGTLDSRGGWGLGGRWIAGDASHSTDSIPTPHVMQQAALQSNVWGTPFGTDHEANYTVAAPGTSAVQIFVRGNSPSANGQTEGYELGIGATGAVGIRRHNNGAYFWVLGVGSFPNPAAGDRYTLQAFGPTISAWRSASGSGTWTLLNWIVDFTYTTGQYIGISSKAGNVGTVDAFGGGPLGVGPHGVNVRRVWAGR